MRHLEEANGGSDRGAASAVDWIDTVSSRRPESILVLTGLDGEPRD